MAEVDDHDTANGVEIGAEEGDDVVKTNGLEDNDEDTTLSKTDIITVDDRGDDAPSKTITDAVFFANISEEEKQYYEKKAPSQASLETMTIQCTACWKQVK